MIRMNYYLRKLQMKNRLARDEDMELTPAEAAVYDVPEPSEWLPEDGQDEWQDEPPGDGSSLKANRKE